MAITLWVVHSTELGALAHHCASMLRKEVDSSGQLSMWWGSLSVRRTLYLSYNCLDHRHPSRETKRSE